MNQREYNEYLQLIKECIPDRIESENEREWKKKKETANICETLRFINEPLNYWENGKVMLHQPYLEKNWKVFKKNTCRICNFKRNTNFYSSI